MKLLSFICAFALALTVLTGCSGKTDAPARASEQEYIGIDSAKVIALEKAGLNESDISGLEIELDRERTYAAYEISFVSGGFEYEYDVDAVSGEIVRTYREVDDDSKLPTPTLSDETPSAHHDETSAEHHEEEEHHEETSASHHEEEEHHEETSASHHEEEEHHDEHHEAVTTAPAAENTAPAATESAYIGAESAKNIALEHASLSASEVYGLEAELDRERGVVVYDVSFDADGFDYDYEIDAVSGEILRADKERDDDYRPASTTASTDYIGSERAEKIALDHAGYTADEVYSLKSELDREGGVVIYDVSFEVEGYDYDYDINASSGQIIRNEKEPDNDAPKTKRTDDKNNYITADKAKEIALKHAGLNASDVWQLEAEFDFEHGAAIYDVSFEQGGYEYDYDIDAVSGEIVRSDKERD